ncbi:MAG: hypothetical protein V4702_01530 [Patescibacteria group bacterium]
MNSRQYTVRGIPPTIDKELRTMARRSGKSLNAITLEVLRVGVGMPDYKEPNYQLDDLFGKLDKQATKQLNAASKKLRVIDQSDWK